LSTGAAVRDDHFHFDGVDYFRGHAAAVQLGDVGERRNPAGSHSHLAMQARPRRDTLPIARVTPIDLHDVTVRGSDIEVDLVVAEVGVLGPSTVARQLRDRTLCLIKVEAAARELIDAANASADVLDTLRRAGTGARLVHQVFVVLETATARDLAQAARWSIDGADGVLELTGFAADGRRSAVALAVDATFAYLLLKPRWLGQRIADAAPDSWSPP
jgi:hypothetical protein